MSTLVERGLSLLAEKLPEQAGIAVTFYRGAVAIAWTAAVGRTDAPMEVGAVLIEEHTEADFLGPAATLLVEGEPIEPRTGDRIVYADGGKTYTYQVAPMFGKEKCFRYSGPAHAMLRVHANLVNVR